MKVILASASPRRKELLGRIFSDFEICATDVDESIPYGMKAEKVPEYLASKKANAICEKDKDSLIIAADTVVILDKVILGKPESRKDAEEMLRLLSDKSHKVITGCCLKQNDKTHSFSVKSTVTFYPLSKEEISAYVSSGASDGKAGAYGIQDLGGLFVKEIHGDYYNIVGLPIARLKRELKLF